MAATDANDGIASFSDVGDVAAPGVDIFGAFPDCGGGSSFYLRDNNGIQCRYDYANGTSAATPLVAGAAALVWSANPAGLTKNDVRTALEATATDVAGSTRDGAGRISACDALNYLGYTCTEPDGGAAPGITVTPTGGLVTTEAGGSDTFTVVLDSEPTAGVSIAVSSSDVGEGAVSLSGLTFTAVNWNVPQTVTITSVDDQLDDGDRPYTILTAAAVSGDSDYDGLDPDDVSVTNTDDNTAGITVSPTSGLLAALIRHDGSRAHRPAALASCARSGMERNLGACPCNAAVRWRVGYTSRAPWRSVSDISKGRGQGRSRKVTWAATCDYVPRTC